LTLWVVGLCVWRGAGAIAHRVADRG
jgi:hypothetical protein